MCNGDDDNEDIIQVARRMNKAYAKVLMDALELDQDELLTAVGNFLCDCLLGASVYGLKDDGSRITEQDINELFQSLLDHTIFRIRERNER